MHVSVEEVSLRWLLLVVVGEEELEGGGDGRVGMVTWEQHFNGLAQREVRWRSSLFTVLLGT